MTDRQNRQLGSEGPEVFPIALGCMGMTGIYGPSNESECIATIHEALDQGITLIDTGDFYDIGLNEMLIGRALRGRRSLALLSVKFGALRSPDQSWSGYDARPAAVKNFLAYSLNRLGVDHIDIYRPARLDPNVPIEETIGAIADLIKAGYVRYAGLSEVGPETIRRANAVSPICDLQIEYSLISRGPERTIFPVLKELGIGVTAYAVLSRGLLSGWEPAQLGDFRANMPRFKTENLAQNRKLVEKLRDLAAANGVSASQLAIAWVMTKEKRIVQIARARTRTAGESLSLAGREPIRNSADRAEIVLSVAGDRYDRTMSMLDVKVKIETLLFSRRNLDPIGKQGKTGECPHFSRVSLPRPFPSGWRVYASVPGNSVAGYLHPALRV
jgi:aryl-alcohol dehydrogenase-like predicted oxidoreductase